MDQKILRIGLDVTKRCNRGCSHCLYDCTDKPTSYLKATDIISLLKELDQLDYDCFEFSISGGEPFLNPEIVEIFDILGRHKKTQKILIVTSGFLKNDPEIGLFKKVLARRYIIKVRFRLSFNSYAKSFPERLETTLDLLLNSKALGFAIQSCISYQTFEKTYKQLEKILRKGKFRKYLSVPKTFDPSYIRIYTDSRRFIPLDVLAEESILEDTLWVGLCKNKKRIKFFLIDYFFLCHGGRAKNLTQEETRITFCSALSSTPYLNRLIIDHDKKVYPHCPCLPIKGMDMGIFGKDSMEDLLQKSDNFRTAIVREILNDKRMFTPDSACDICKGLVFEKRIFA